MTGYDVFEKLARLITTLAAQQDPLLSELAAAGSLAKETGELLVWLDVLDDIQKVGLREYANLIKRIARIYGYAELIEKSDVLIRLALIAAPKIAERKQRLAEDLDKTLGIEELEEE